MKKKINFRFLAIIAAGVFLWACAAHTPATSNSPQPPPDAVPAGEDQAEGTRSDEAPLSGQDELDWLDEEDDQAVPTVADPLEGFNRAMFQVNDKLYFWVLKPVASGYRKVVPQPARIGVKNFFDNLGFPIRFVNSILQGKGRAAEAELTRFLYNSTVGVLGFGNPSKKHPQLAFDPEDLGQTLGRYGISNGFYLVWPFFGPSTLRDSFGMAGDRFLNPVPYVEPSEAAWGLQGVETINSTSFRIGDYESMKNAALDPYESLRTGYLQLRRTRIKK